MQRESGWDNISSCFAWSDWNEPSDLVSTTESVFPSRTSSRNQAANFTSVLIPKACVMFLWFWTAALQPDASFFFFFLHSAPVVMGGWAKVGWGFIVHPLWKWHIGTQRKTQEGIINCTGNASLYLSADPWRCGGPERQRRIEAESGMRRQADACRNPINLLIHWKLSISNYIF